MASWEIEGLGTFKISEIASLLSTKDAAVYDARRRYWDTERAVLPRYWQEVFWLWSQNRELFSTFSCLDEYDLNYTIGFVREYEFPLTRPEFALLGAWPVRQVSHNEALERRKKIRYRPALQLILHCLMERRRQTVCQILDLRSRQPEYQKLPVLVNLKRKIER